MQIALIQPSTAPDLQPLLQQWGQNLIAVSSTCDVHLNAADPTPLLFLLNRPALGNLPAMLAECAAAAPGRPYRTLALVDRSEPQTIEQAAANGVDDVLSCPFEPAELRLRLTCAQSILEYSRKALYDSLSGLLNHGAITDLLQRELQRSRRANAPVAVVMCDIDLFKPINDTYGHQAGDAAIQAVASRLKSQVRPYDYVGRYGGDEFLIVLINCGPSQAQDICQRIRSAIASVPVETSRGEIQIAMSLGLAVFDPIREVDAKRIIHMADIALYEAKKSGRNRVILATQMPS